MEQHFSIKVLSGIYSILKVKDSPGLPEIVNRTGNGFFSLMRIEGEWTIICEAGEMPDDALVVDRSHGWRVFLIDEPLTLDMIGVIYRITEILKDAGISVMAISAFSTDAFLVREDDLQPSLRALQAGKFSVSYDNGDETMSIHEPIESEYDKAGDFYINWLDKNVPNRDTQIQPSIEIMLAMLGDVQGTNVCDLGCGEGYLSRILANRGALVTGVDTSRILLRHAREHSNQLGITYFLDDAQSMNQISDASMDAVICNMALMDIPDLTATFSSVRRVLVDGGKFVFSILHPCFFTPFNAENPPEDLDEEGNFKALRVTRYGLEGKWFSDGIGMCGTLGSHHRTLSTYFNTLSASGFQLEEVSEPLAPVLEATAKCRESIVPTLLIAKSIALPT